MITKSQYLVGQRCEKALWLNKYKADELCERNTHRIEVGIKVGEVARGLIPGGVLIEYNFTNINAMIEATKEAMATNDVIYEGTFMFNDVLVRCDILKRTENGWNMYEVKSTTDVFEKKKKIITLKERYKNDLSIQYYVLSKLGYNIENVNIVYINNQYVRNGDLELDKLFNIEEVNIHVKFSIKDMEPILEKYKTMLAHSSEPVKNIGEYCLEPEECQWKEYCWSHIPNNSVFHVTGTYLKKQRKFKLYNNGIITFKDIVDRGIILSENAMVQIECELENKEILKKDEIRAVLDEFKYPLYFLDFETFQQPIPEFNGVKPYAQIPFQYSLHILREENGELEHREFLAKEGQDNIREFAESLLKDMGTEGSVIVYNKGFECTRIVELAEMYPDIANELSRINSRVKDLMVPFQKRYYYNKNLKGSHSIKYVLPTMIPNDPELDYSKLNISNGSMAMNTFATLHEKDEETIKQTREELLKYCCLDTLAMVRIWEKLKEKVQ